MAQDTVRVLRIIEYIGPRDKIEKQIAGSVHGTKECGNGVIIRAGTIGTFPEVLIHNNEQWMAAASTSEEPSNG